MNHALPSLIFRIRGMVRNACVSVRDIGLVIFDHLVTCGITRKEALPAGVCCVRMDALGDFVLWLDSARAIRKMHDSQRLVLYCDTAAQELARLSQLFDEVVVVDQKKFRKNLSYRARVLRQLRRYCFERLLHPVFSRDGDFADGESIVRMARADQKIGFAGSHHERGWRSRFCDRYYTRLIDSPHEPMMELQRNAIFIRSLGLTDFQPGLPSLSDVPALQSNEPYFVVFPGAGVVHRRWPVGRFAEIARRTHLKTGWRCVVCGSTGEASLARQIEDLYPSFVTNRAGQTDLAAFISILAGAKFVISNDTSTVHLASAVGVPSVCILGGGEPGRFVPYDVGKWLSGSGPRVVHVPQPCDGCKWRCIYPLGSEDPFPCIDAVSVEAVWDAVCDSLERLETSHIHTMGGVR